MGLLMFEQMLGDFKGSVGTALRLSFLVAVAGLAFFIASLFLCAAAFVLVLQRYGLIEACLTGAGVFLVVTLIAAVCYIVRTRQAKAQAAQAAESVAQGAFTDPMLVSAGIQIFRAIGIKKLIPILAVGGLALGLIASRSARGEEPPS